MFRSKRLMGALVLLLSISLTLLVLRGTESFEKVKKVWPFTSPTDPLSIALQHEKVHHPIDDLRAKAHSQFDALWAKRTDDLGAAAAAYRARRGRYPPPDFDKWFEYAKKHDCIVIEDFFDRIYHDLNPFWALQPDQIRRSAASATEIISIRSGNATQLVGESIVLKRYFSAFQELQSLLPDVIIPINAFDESRILVPWEVINEHILAAARDKDTSLSVPTIASYPSLRVEEIVGASPNWLAEGPYWDLYRAACPPTSSARSALIDSDFSTPPVFPHTWPNQSYHGFVANWTTATDPCIHDHLRNIHGSFVEPISQSTAIDLVPMFGAAKLPMNNDILLPAPVYFTKEQMFSIVPSNLNWNQRRDEVLWRGSASGGRNTVRNWTRFQRHRLLSMLNATQVELLLQHNQAQNSDHLLPTNDSIVDPVPTPLNFPAPNDSLYFLYSHSRGVLSAWLRRLTNAAFTWLVCFPETPDYACSYTGDWYSRGQEMTLQQMFEAKFLPDVDGNSFSGRYRAFLQSGSLPIKATVYSEWHDDRLIAWHHFVPMDNTFMDLWAILEYLVSHDEEARQMAEGGRDWAGQVLRREDMLLYTYRLILEYARISSDDRHKMGWAADL